MIPFCRRVLLGLVVGAMATVALPEATAQSGPNRTPPQTAPEDSIASAKRDSTRHPNEIPYRSNRTFAQHLLALPSYVLHGVTRPLGWAIHWGQRKILPLYQEYFTGPRGVFPVVELGGETAASAGFVAYDDRVLGTRQRVRLRALWGSRRVNDFRLSYGIPAPVGAGTHLSFSAHYFNHPSRRFFLDGNRSTPADETRFALEQFQVSTRLEYRPRRLFGGHLTVEFERATTARSTVDEERGKRLPLTTPGLGNSERLQVQTGLKIDGTQPGPRATTGTRVQLGLRYDQELGSDHFYYGGYSIEVQQFVPVLIFPETRRLAIRARLQQSESLSGDRGLPFYELSRLGSKSTLRGFENTRFTDEGFLLFNVEYRYPIWDNMDGVLFVDTGQVFGGLGDIPENQFHTSGGAGIHLLGKNGPRFRFEVAFGSEGARVILTGGPTF